MQSGVHENRAEEQRHAKEEEAGKQAPESGAAPPSYIAVSRQSNHLCPLSRPIGDLFPARLALRALLDASVAGAFRGGNAEVDTEEVRWLTFFLASLAWRLRKGFAEESYWQVCDPPESRVIGHEERAAGQQCSGGMNGIGRF